MRQVFSHRHFSHTDILVEFRIRKKLEDAFYNFSAKRYGITVVRVFYTLKRLYSNRISPFCLKYRFCLLHYKGIIRVL